MPSGVSHICTVVTQLRSHTQWVLHSAAHTALLFGFSMGIFVYPCLHVEEGAAVADCAWSTGPPSVRMKLSQRVSIRLASYPNLPWQSASGNDGMWNHPQHPCDLVHGGGQQRHVSPTTAETETETVPGATRRWTTLWLIHATDKSHTHTHKTTHGHWVQASTTVIFYPAEWQCNETQHAWLWTF